MPRWHPFETNSALVTAAVDMVTNAAAQAISARGKFRIVLAGGTTPRAIYEKLVEIKTDWRAWHIYFGDERCLPPHDPERNSAMADAAWLTHVPIPPEHIHVIPAELGAAKAASEYAKVLQGVPEFDLVLLGLGEDGHTASLFPGNEWGTEPASPSVLAVHHAPKPPAERVTLSAWRLSRARQVMFLVSGASKHEAVMQWRNGTTLPASAITPVNGVDVLVDEAAADFSN